MATAALAVDKTGGNQGKLLLWQRLRPGVDKTGGNQGKRGEGEGEGDTEGEDSGRGIQLWP